MRRLPVYLVIDVSGSMSGEPIEAVRTGMQMMHSALLRDPHALEQAFLSVITFDSNAQQVTPLTEVSSFQAPHIDAGGGTSLGAALKLTAECIERDVVKKGTPGKEADWKPLVFLFTDGAPTDNYQEGLAKFRQLKCGIVVACAAGGANLGVLQEIAGENVVTLATTNSDSIQAFFKFLSASISTRSVRPDADAGGLNSLPPLPPELSVYTR